MQDVTGTRGGWARNRCRSIDHVDRLCQCQVVQQSTDPSWDCLDHFTPLKTPSPLWTKEFHPFLGLIPDRGSTIVHHLRVDPIHLGIPRGSGDVGDNGHSFHICHHCDSYTFNSSHSGTMFAMISFGKGVICGRKLRPPHIGCENGHLASRRLFFQSFFGFPANFIQGGVIFLQMGSTTAAPMSPQLAIHQAQGRQQFEDCDMSRCFVAFPSHETLLSGCLEKVDKSGLIIWIAHILTWLVVKVYWPTTCCWPHLFPLQLQPWRGMQPSGSLNIC